MRNLLIFLLAELVLLAACRRGGWFAVSGSNAAYSEDGITKVIEQCLNAGVDTIYFSVWDQSMTNFHPTEAFSRKYPFIKFNPKFHLDPLEVLIARAHAANLKVFAWF